MARRVTTIFLRDDSINVAVIEGHRVEKWAIGQLQPGLVSQGSVTDQSAVAAAIRDVFRQNQIKSGKVVTGISGSSSLYRLITLPEMPDALLGEAVRREARRVLPVSLDDVNLSYQDLPSINKGEKRLFLATYPKANVEGVVKTLRQAGLSPYLVDLAPLALARIPDTDRCVIVNVRGNQADIIIVEDRLPQLIRVLSLPVESGSLEEKLPAVTEELGRTVIFYNSSHAEKPLNNTVPLYVCGDLASEHSLWPKLTGRLNFEVSIIPAPLEHADDFPALDFMVNMGLALKEFAVDREDSHSSIVNLNILPAVYQPKKVPISTVLLPVMGIIGAGILAYMASFVFRGRSETDTLRTQLSQSALPIPEQTQKIAALKSEVTRVSPLGAPIDAQVAQLNTTAAAFRSAMASYEINRTKVDTDLAKKVVGLLPASKTFLSLTSVNHDGTIISITGNAASEDYIFQYTRKLRESGNSILISTIQANTQTDDSGALVGPAYTFSVTMR